MFLFLNKKGVIRNMEISKTELELMPANAVETENIANLIVIPEISKDKYRTAYKTFMNWRREQGAISCSENVLLAYFDELSKKFKASTLWTLYSMLRATLNINNSVDISNYVKLRAFLKRTSDGYQPTKTKIFTSDEVNRFIKEAPDKDHLLRKVVLIVGIMGACRMNELYKLEKSHFKDLGSAVLVEIPKLSQVRLARKLILTGHLYEIFKKYANLRPKNVKDSCFFLNYQKGKCTAQKVGIHKLGSIGKQIATYLKLPNPELFTGHCFRRCSTTVHIDTGEDPTALKRWVETIYDRRRVIY